MGRSARLVLLLAAVVIGIAAPGSRVAWAQALVDGPSVQQATGNTRWPAVAFDTQNGVYLVVWGNSTIRGLFVNDDGTAAGSVFQISDSSVNAQTPRVAYSPDVAAFLVVWQSSDGVTGNVNGTRVRGRMVSFTTGVSPNPTQVYSNGDYTTLWERAPAVAYSTASQQFLVAYNIGAATGAEISARLVDTSASPVGDEIAVTASSGDYDRDTAVGYFPSTDRFVVAWSGTGPSVDFVRTMLYSASDGSPVGSAVTIAQNTYTYVPDLAYNAATSQMFVTWIQNTSGWRPFGTFVDDAGAVLLTSPIQLSSTVGSYDANSVAYNVRAMTFFMVTHGSTEQDFGFEIDGAGSPVAAATAVTSVTASGLTGCFNPRIGASTTAPGWLIATAASFSSLWTQLITGTDLGGGGTVTPKLTISPRPSGGTVTGGGLTCGTGGTTCQVTFTEPTSVTLTAAADSGFAFTTWGGSCSSSGTSTTATIQVSSIKTCTATFTAVWGGAGTEPSGCPAAPTVGYAGSAGPIGTSISQFTGGTQNQDVAYSRCQQVYLAVWGSGGAIRGRFIDEDGAGVGSVFDISSGNWAQTPKVVYNPNLGTFFVAWHSTRIDPGTGQENGTEVRGAIVTYPPGAASAGVLLSSDTLSSRWITRPAIGYSTGSGHYLVAWARYTAADADLSARLVDTLGATVGNELSVTSTTADYDREPTVGYFPAVNRFLVAWAGTGTGVDFVRGQLYDASTGATYGTAMELAQTTYTYVPEASLNTASGNMFVAWIQSDPAAGGWRPHARFVSGDGVLTPAVTLSATEGSYDGNSIDYNPLSRTFFLVTHGSSTLQDVGFEINGDGTPIGVAATVTSITAPGLTGSFNPRLAASKRQPRWLIATAASFTSLWTQLIGGTQPGIIYQLNVTTPTHGTVTGGGINCGTSGTACWAVFETSTPVTLTAAPDAGYALSGWGGDCSGTASTASVTVDGVRSCTATFTAVATGGVVGDFTGDLKADILWRHVTQGDVWLWPMNGTTRTSETYVNTVADTNWEIRAIADFSGDGLADLMWRNTTTGMVYLWTMSGATRSAETYVGTVETAYDITSAGDYNGDGRADLLWRNTATGDVWVWLMNGAAIDAANFVATVDPAYAVKGSGDLNADGYCDIVWHNGTTGEVWAWLSSGTASFSQAYVSTVPDTGYQIRGVADFSGDGKADVLWRHATQGDVWVWLMNGSTVSSENWVATVADMTYQIANTGDYDGDTRADILWWNSANGEVWIWLMNGASRTSETWIATVPDTGYRIVR